MTTLSFEIRNTVNVNGDTEQIDGSYNNIIERLRITSNGGVDLEDTRNYGHLHQALSNVKYGITTRVAKYGEGFGMVNTRGASYGTGEIPLANNGGTQIVHIPLISALIGSSASKYLPLFAIPHLQLELQIANNCFISSIQNVVAVAAVQGGAAAIVGVTPPENSFQISNVCLNCQIIEFPQEVNDSLLRMISTSGIYLHATTFSNFVQSFPVGTNNPTIVISERLKSVKSILNIFTPSSRTNTNRRMFSHISNNISGYQIKIGSDLYPAQKIGDNGSNSDSSLLNADFITQTLMGLGEYNSIYCQSIMNNETFSVQTPDDGNYGICSANVVNRTMYGIDLDAFSMSPIESGVNAIINSPISIHFTGGKQIIAYDAHTFIMHDVLFSLLPNGSFVVSK